jgi:predicted RNase H-like nuclease (RuvC/YqgF family)
VKLVKKFSKEELEKAEIVEGDIVYIADASGGSKSSAEFLCSKKIKAVITGSEMSHVAREVFDSFGIPRIRKEEVDIIEGSEVAFVGHNFEEVYKSKLEEMRRKAVERIEKLFEDYKKRRI